MNVSVRSSTLIRVHSCEAKSIHKSVENVFVIARPLMTTREHMVNIEDLSYKELRID